MKRWRHRSDKNSQAIIDGLEQMGATVLRIESGSPDLVVGFRKRNYLFEVKSKKWSPMTPSQLKLFQEWRGQITRIECLYDALAIIRKDGAITLQDQLEDNISTQTSTDK